MQRRIYGNIFPTFEIKKKSPQAVKNVLEDFRATKKSLSDTADSIVTPDSAKLTERNLKRLN